VPTARGIIGPRPRRAPKGAATNEERTTAAVQRYLDALAGDSPSEPVVRTLLDRAVRRLHFLCVVLLHRSYPRLTHPPLNLQSDELLGAVVERLLKALREARPATVRQFFALAGQHMRWELNDLARRLDGQPNAVELSEDRVPTPASSASGLTPAGLRMLEAIGDLPADEREAFDLVRIQGMTHPGTASRRRRSAVRSWRHSTTGGRARTRTAGGGRSKSPGGRTRAPGRGGALGPERATTVRADDAATDELIRTAPGEPESVSLQVRLARQRATRGGDAVGFLRRVQAVHPDDFRAAFWLAEALETRGDPAAIGCYRVALAIRPQAAAAHLRLGVALGNQGHLAEATEHSQRALQFDPDSDKAHYLPALTHLVCGRLDPAADHCRETIRISPGLASVTTCWLGFSWNRGGSASPGPRSGAGWNCFPVGNAPTCPPPRPSGGVSA